MPYVAITYINKSQFLMELKENITRETSLEIKKKVMAEVKDLQFVKQKMEGICCMLFFQI